MYLLLEFCYFDSVKTIEITLGNFFVSCYFDGFCWFFFDMEPIGLAPTRVLHISPHARAPMGITEFYDMSHVRTKMRYVALVAVRSSLLTQ